MKYGTVIFYIFDRCKIPIYLLIPFWWSHNRNNYFIQLQQVSVLKNDLYWKWKWFKVISMDFINYKKIYVHEFYFIEQDLTSTPVVVPFSDVANPQPFKHFVYMIEFELVFVPYTYVSKIKKGPTNESSDNIWNDRNLCQRCKLFSWELSGIAN